MPPRERPPIEMIQVHTHNTEVREGFFHTNGNLFSPGHRGFLKSPIVHLRLVPRLSLNPTHAGQPVPCSYTALMAYQTSAMLNRRLRSYPC